VKLSSQLRQVPRLYMRGAITPLPIRLQVMILAACPSFVSVRAGCLFLSLICINQRTPALAFVLQKGTDAAGHQAGAEGPSLL
jgi:hypothetical protein